MHPGLRLTWNEFLQDFLQVHRNLPSYKPVKIPYLTRLTLLAKKLQSQVKYLQADKNLGIVVMDHHDYERLCLDHLQDASTYRLLSPSESTSLHDTMTERHLQMTAQAGPYLSPLQLAFLTHEDWEYKLPNFHVLPKLHKSGPLKGRPIVGATAWFTTPASKLLDRLLLPHLEVHNQVLKNTPAAINLVRNLKIPDQTLLVTLDVTSLYTNIHLPLLQALLDTLPQPCSTLLSFITNNNFFTFGGQVYQQVQGIAMGTNSAVNLANLYLATYLDPHLMNHPQVLAYGRYIDDILLVWTGDHTDLNTFVSQANTLVPGIKLTMNCSSTNMPFLDISLTISNGRITYAPYSKPMSRFLYLPFHSSHPSHILSGWLKGEAIRLLRHSPSPFTYKTELEKFITRLRARGYPHPFITKALSGVTWSQASHDKALAVVAQASTDTNPMSFLVLRHSLQPPTPLYWVLRKWQSQFRTYTGSSIHLAWSMSPNLSKLLLGTKHTKNVDVTQAQQP